MESTFVVSGSHKNVKKQKKPFFLPEIFVENEETVRQRSSSLIKHSTPYQSSEHQLSDVQSGGLKKECMNLDTSVDSGFDDYSLASSIYSRNDSIRSDYTTFKTPHVKPADSLWESFATPMLDLKQHFKSRQSFVDDRVKIKLNFETLVTVCLGVVMFSSIVFSVYMGTHYTKTSYQNGKYKSIEYGSNKRIKTLKEEGRIIDYDIKDENGNVLGGKRAAIQFAYEQKYGKKPTNNVQQDMKPDEILDSKPDEAPLPRRADNEVRSRVIPQVVEATVEEPVPSTQNEQDLGIAELSRKIDELDALLQDDLMASKIEIETATKINGLKERKKRLMDKVKSKPSVRPVVHSTPEPVVDKVMPVKSRRAANAKAVKTKVENPLTKSIPEAKQSKPKKIKKSVVEAADTKASVDVSDKNEYPGSEDSFDVDPGLVDYPDDPQFRSPVEF